MKRYVSILLAIVYGAFPLFAQDKAAEIDKLMQSYYDYGKFNGAVLVAESGKVIFKKGYGLANMEWNIPNETDTKFRIASITKQFTSMLIMQLVEEGKVKMDGKITDYIPDYRKDIGEQVTIHHLLTHTSGIPEYWGLLDFLGDLLRDPYVDYLRDPYSVDEFVKKYCSGDLEFEPGSKYSYNNSGYYLSGAIIEKVTGKTYEECLKEKILDPIGMKNSGYDHHKSILMNRASGYVRTFDGYNNEVYADMTIPYAAGSMYSTVEDLYLWDQALYSEELLSKEYKDIMFTPYLNNYAYGWWVVKMPIIESKDSIKVVIHNGWIFGFRSLISRLVDDKHLIILVDNADGSNEMTEGIVNILYGKPYDMPKKDITEILYKTISKKDVASAKKQYYEFKDMYPDDYDYGKEEINGLGVRLRDAGMFDEAIEIYKWIIEIDPDWFEGYNGIADVYRMKGDKALAIKYYAKSLEMNPERWYAISISEMLKVLTEEDK